jgi:hypothetical protein
MLCWITILGGVLIMMGQHSRSEALFYYADSPTVDLSSRFELVGICYFEIPDSRPR